MAKIVGDLRVCKEPYFRKTEFEWKVNEFSKLKPAEAPGVARSSLLEPRLSVQSPIFKYGGQDCQLTLCTSPSRAAVGFICVKEPRFTYPCKVEIGARKVVTHELGSTIELRDLSREKSFDRKDISAGDKDELLIRCTIESWADAVSRDSIRHKLRVCDRLDELLESSDLSDVKLVVAGTEIAAHRAILGALSPYFKAMFSQKMKESLEGVVRIDDVALPVFRVLLKFIYTGDCDLEAEAESSDESEEKEHKNEKEGKANEAKSLTPEQKRASATDLAMQLLIAADRFQLTALVSLCADHVRDHINTANVADVLMLADKTNQMELKQRAVTFFCEHKFSRAAIMATDSFKKLSAALLRELLAAV